MSRYREVLDTDTPAAPARLAWATIARVASPGFSVCLRCGAPWNVVEPHETNVPRSPSGCFPLCEHCWAPLTPEERLPYYVHLIKEWTEEGHPPEPAWVEMLGVVVMAGG